LCWQDYCPLPASAWRTYRHYPDCWLQCRKKVQYKDLNLTIWDVGGQHKIRPLWRHYYEHTSALIYVVDASELERLNEAAEEFKQVINDELLKDVAILVFANKMDLEGTVSPQYIAEKFELTKEKKRLWYVQPSIASKGEGVLQGVDWMARAIKKKSS